MPRPPRQLASKCHVDLVHLRLLGCPPSRHLLRSREIYTRTKCVKIFFPLFNFLHRWSELASDEGCSPKSCAQAFSFVAQVLPGAPACLYNELALV